jgi:hypothetical protein
MNTVTNTRLRLTTQVGQDHTATGVLPALGTNNQPHRPEKAAEHKPRALLTYTGQAGEYHHSNQSLPGETWRLLLNNPYTDQAGVAHRSDRFKPESPKTPNRPTELQTDPNSKQQQQGTTANPPKCSPKQKPN